MPHLERVAKGKMLVVDDSFSVDVRRTTAIGRELERRRLAVRLYWNAQVPNLLVPEMLEAMAPFTDGILVGAESFEEDTIRRIGKRFAADDISKAVEIAAGLGLDHTLIVSFIIGYPWHSKADVVREIDRIFDLLQNSRITVTLNWLTLNPGSQMWSDRYGDEGPPQREFGRLYPLWTHEGVGVTMEELAELNRYLAYLKHSLGADAYRLQPRSGIFELMT
jgi:anaerobic magnesium-protoporphyrin IX monomethyl ester cyclase